jgi:hypothetical protein
MAQHAARGMLASGLTLREMERLAVEHLTSSFKAAATFAYSLADHYGPEVSDPLKAFGPNCKWDACGAAARTLGTRLKVVS